MVLAQPHGDDVAFEPGATIANYAIEELLGQGSEGLVFVARDTLLGRRVAIKTLRAGEAGETRGVEEARLLATLEHPNIVRVYHARRHQGAWYVVYELLPGGSLQGLIERVGPLPAERALDYAAQAAAGLAFAHQRGILHRDVKPHNMLLGARQEVKVGDFGLAFDARGEARQQSLVGTPAFLAPEVGLGGAATAASDVFSLGACLFLFLSGRLPFVAANRDQLKQAQAEVEPKLPPGLPAPVSELVCAMLAKEPAARPPSQDLPGLLEKLATAPYTRPRRCREPEAPPLPSPFGGGGPERALREALRSGRDVAYVTELVDRLSRAERGVELYSAWPGDALVLIEVAREIAAEKRPICAQLMIPNSRTSLGDVIERQLGLRGPQTLTQACETLLMPARRVGSGALLVVHAPRGLSTEQIAQLELLSEAGERAGVASIVALPSSSSPSEQETEARLPGFGRMNAFQAVEPARELEERLKLWLGFTTDWHYRFSVDALRLTAHYCRNEGRFWANLALQSLLISSAAGLRVVTSWAVTGAHGQQTPWYDPSEVPAAWRRRPLSWPDAAAARVLASLRQTARATPAASAESIDHALGV